MSCVGLRRLGVRDKTHLGLQNANNSAALDQAARQARAEMGRFSNKQKNLVLRPRPRRPSISSCQKFGLGANSVVMFRVIRPKNANAGPRGSDNPVMASPQLHRSRRAATTAAGQLLAGAIAVACVACPAFAAQDDEEDLQPDLNALRAKAESGNVKAQTRLADFCIASDDFTNAVIWYRKAAQQDDVTAQLSLASLLMAGRGTARNPQEAARWLRAAADRIEGKKPASADNPTTPATNMAPASTPAAIIITRTNTAAATNAPPPLPPGTTNSVARVGPSTNITRVPRADIVHQAEPKLQDAPPVLRSPGEGK